MASTHVVNMCSMAQSRRRKSSLAVLEMCLKFIMGLLLALPGLYNAAALAANSASAFTPPATSASSCDPRPLCTVCECTTPSGSVTTDPVLNQPEQPQVLCATAMPCSKSWQDAGVVSNVTLGQRSRLPLPDTNPGLTVLEADSLGGIYINGSFHLEANYNLQRIAAFAFRGVTVAGYTFVGNHPNLTVIESRAFSNASFGRGNTIEARTQVRASGKGSFVLLGFCSLTINGNPALKEVNAHTFAHSTFASNV